MSARSRREHKPTSKFLNFYTSELGSAEEEPKKVKKVKNKTTPKINRVPAVSTPKIVKTTSLKKKEPSAKRKLLKDGVQIMDKSPKALPSSTSPNSSDIRRSSRQHKPNQKLKEFIHSSHDARRTSITGTGLFSTTPSSPVKNKAKKVAAATAGSGSKRPTSTKKSIATISPMIRQEGIEAPIMGSKNISVELVDCFEALERDLAKTHPVTQSENSSIESTPVSNHSNDKASDDRVRSNSTTNRSRRNVKGAETEEQISPPQRATTKRSREENKRSPEEPLAKQKRLAPSVVRSLVRTRKSTDTITPVKTVDLSSPLNNKKGAAHRKNSRETKKQYPLRRSALEKSSSPSKHPSSPATRHTPRQLAQQRGAQKINLSTTPSAHSIQKERNSQQQQQDHQQQGIKETLKKFLIMGTKVANAISETLKHNEEALLSKSSAFEKKCLSLVHALARQGSDLEEDDMEKVLKLLDEEQEERRLYRHTFLESLRVSHLTNMALYNQMLRLLKTL